MKTKLLHAILPALSFFMIFGAFPCTAAEMDEHLTRCSRLEDDAERLNCFDELVNRLSPANREVTSSTIEKKAAPTVTMEGTNSVTPDREALSVMERRWDMRLEPRREGSFFVLWPYRPSYFLPVAYNSSPNKDAALDFDPRAKAMHNEVKFQLSFKVKLWRDIIRSNAVKEVIEKNTGIRGIDLWVAYTQQSFWQLYNSEFSAPFRETNYEPELLLNLRMQREIPYLMGTKLQFINFGFNHQSNGRSEPLSRSWNRIVANVAIERPFSPGKADSWGLLAKTWVRIPEDDAGDDNPDITDYMGYGELWGTLYLKKQRFAAMLRNNLRSDNRGAVQLEWSVPLSAIHRRLANKISLYVQYFNGYGESLLDYNKSTNRISAGVMLADWN